MRPVLAADSTLSTQVPGRADSLARARSTAPMACFITTESDMDSAQDRSRPRIRQQSERRKQQTDTRQTLSPNQRPSPTRIEGSETSSSWVEQDMLRHSPRPDTPFTGLSDCQSALSTSSSRRSSLVASSVEYQSSRGEDMAAWAQNSMSNDRIDESSIPQLIMPSLIVPRRRPFSEVGKSLGKLKIMVSGRAGIGKTTLIKSLAQRCEHIVHMDPIDSEAAANATEIYASSRPHPWWRTDSDLATPTGRRRSSIGEVLDRNVCFVESPGHQDGNKVCSADPIHHLSSIGSQHVYKKCLLREPRYIQSCLDSMLAKPMEDTDLLALVNAGGEPVVDVLLYLISSEGLDKYDVECIKHVQNMTNVIPILARTDELSGDATALARQRVAQELADEGLECFSFAGPDGPETMESLQVYAISTETQPDYDTMDASVLMNSEYFPPLVPTDLNRLVGHLFSVDGSARLRHSAALKPDQ
ncbi:hypothetical protein G7046_g2264 [Stylonectria norvegica]|nr:hypothetical protein G7046_g2264 [Stylonectria norvegica]